MNPLGMGSGMSGMGSGMSGMGSGMSDMPGMMMYFHSSFSEYILFEKLLTHTKGEFAGACVAVFVWALLYELLKYLREELQRRQNLKVSHVLLHGSHEEKALALSTRRRLLSPTHLLQTLLHGVQILMSYCLMLVFMTYNVYLGLCIILGGALGYFVTGWRRSSQLMDQNEHCH